MKKIFEGICTALVTPFKHNKKIDYKSFKHLLELQIKDEVDAILILGTTGEASTISYRERKKLIRFSKKIINNRTKLLVGCGCNYTKLATKYTYLAQKYKADGAVIVTPYYNKCSQYGLIEHYKYITTKTKIPIIVYNVPSRTGVNILPKTMIEISKLKNIVGIKEANDDKEHIDNLFKLLNGKTNIYCGTDSLNYYFFSKGAVGAISVLSTIKAEQLKTLYKLTRISNSTQAENLSNELEPYSTNLFIDINPIPIKYILYKKGLIKYEYRLPLTKTNIKNEIKLKNIFQL